MRRVIFYLFYDPIGRVDDFVTYKLAALREHAEHIFVVSNSPLEAAGRAALEEVADTVWERENVGFDVYAYREAMARYGADRLAEADELILMNCTFFGPIGSFAPLFADAEARPEVAFWAISDHGEMTPHPFVPTQSRMDRHQQSHWIAVRSAMFTSDAWRRYWDDMPEITSYTDSVVLHEGRFTTYFEQAGFEPWVAYPEADYPSLHPLVENAVDVLRAGCPIVKRRSFFSDPLYLDRRAIDTPAIARCVEELGFPMDMVYRNLARTSEPRVLATNLALVHVLPTASPTPTWQPRVVVAVHVDEPALAGEVFDRVAAFPRGTDVVVTVPDSPDAEAVEESVRLGLDQRGLTAGVRRSDPRGGAVSALLVTCSDLLEPDRYDVLARLTTLTRPEDDDTNVADHLRSYLLTCLAASPAHVLQVLELFAHHASLGMVIAPAPHMGLPTLGHGWGGLRKAVKRFNRRHGIALPLDRDTPLAAYGGMFVARPTALHRLAEIGLQADDFAADAKPRGPVLAGVVELMLTYAALDQGMHVRQVLEARSAALAYAQLEYKYQAVSAVLPWRPEQQLRRIRDTQRRADAAEHALAALREQTAARSDEREDRTSWLGRASRRVRRS